MAGFYFPLAAVPLPTRSGNTNGFSNGSTATTEYTYDNYGNLTQDLNKGISNIQYNSLNLPSVVTFSNGNTITYTYSADGRKLRTAHKVGSTTTTTDYAGNVIYENGVQKKLLTEEGYVDLASGTYYYYLWKFNIKILSYFQECFKRDLQIPLEQFSKYRISKANVIGVNGDTLNIETTLSIPDSDLFECFRLSINNKGTLSYNRIYIEYEE